MHYKLLLMTIIINNIVFPNSIKIQTEVDTSIATIGDVINWRVFTENTTENLDFPSLLIESDSLSIKSQRAIIKDDDIVGRVFEITFWDTGFFYTPNYIVNVLDVEGNVKYDIETIKAPINIVSIFSQVNDNTIRPIKGPLPVKGILPIRLTIIILLIILLVIALIFVWNKRETELIKKNYINNRKSPHEIALSRLMLLDEKGFSKHFYIEISYVLRQYLENTKYIRALEMTTEEISQIRHLFLIDDVIFDDCINLLFKSDLVKYAKKTIDSAEMKVDKDIAISFINNLLKKK